MGAATALWGAREGAEPAGQGGMDTLAAPLRLLEEEGEQDVFGFSPAQTPVGSKSLTGFTGG